MNRLMLLINTLVMAGFASAQLNPQVDLYIGTWRLNIAKSKYTNGPSQQSMTRTYEARGAAFKVTNEGVLTDGSKFAYSFTARDDGKDNPISGGMPTGADTIAWKRIDAQTTDVTTKKAGKVIGTARTVVSKDGKVMTQTAKGTDANGQPTTTITVWEKQ